MAHVYIIFSVLFLFFFQLHLLQCANDEIPTVKVSKQCELDGICDHVENYPTDLVNKIIKNLQKENITFNYDDPLPPTTNETVYPLCETKSKNIAPQSAIDTKGNWQLILNVQDLPIQVFRTTLCRTSPLRCSNIIVFRPGYDGKCEQKWLHRQMFYLNATKQAALDYFRVPTCCSCVLIKTDN